MKYAKDLESNQLLEKTQMNARNSKLVIKELEEEEQEHETTILSFLMHIKPLWSHS